MDIPLGKELGKSQHMCIVCGLKWEPESDSPCGHVNSEGKIVLPKVPDNFPLSPKD